MTNITAACSPVAYVGIGWWFMRPNVDSLKKLSSDSPQCANPKCEAPSNFRTSHVFFRFIDAALLRTSMLWLLIPALTARGQESQPPSALEIVAPHEDVDFTAYTTDLLRAVKHNWYARMPREAKSGAQGIVTVRFKIRKDGKLDDEPIVEASSGKKTLDDAAVSTLRVCAPFESLPPSFKGPYLELRINFLYNLRPAAL